MQETNLNVYILTCLFFFSFMLTHSDGMVMLSFNFIFVKLDKVTHKVIPEFGLLQTWHKDNACAKEGNPLLGI